MQLATLCSDHDSLKLALIMIKPNGAVHIICTSLLWLWHAECSCAYNLYKLALIMITWNMQLCIWSLPWSWYTKVWSDNDNIKYAAVHMKLALIMITLNAAVHIICTLTATSTRQRHHPATHVWCCKLTATHIWCWKVTAYRPLAINTQKRHHPATHAWSCKVAANRPLAINTQKRHHCLMLKNYS